MKNFLKVFFFLSFCALFAFADNAPPPDTAVTDNIQFVMPVPDNFVINQVAADVEYYTYSAREQAEEETFTIESELMTVVREVTACRKISLPKAESGAATEQNAEIAINSTCTNNSNVCSKSFSDTSTKKPCLTGSLKFQRNYQNSNYGYPLSAN